MKFQMCLQLSLGIKLLLQPEGVLFYHVPSCTEVLHVIPSVCEMGRPEAHTGFKTPEHHVFIQYCNNIYHLILNFPKDLTILFSFYHS